MSPPRKLGRDASVRRFFLDRTPDAGAPKLASEDEQHALRVLRLQPGDELVGLDGRGGSWPLAVRSVDGRALELEVRGEPTRDPRPGTPGSPLGRIEACAPLPRGGRAEDMVDRLTQLGVSALRPLLTARGSAASGPERSRRRLERAAREALKQSGRTWLPTIHEPVALEDLLTLPAGPRLFLQPSSDLPLLAALTDAAGTEDAPLVLIAGPEGGLTEDEEAQLRAAGARPVALGPYVLRIETAVEAAVALATCADYGSKLMRSRKDV